MSSRLIEQTKRSLGDLADGLLEAGAIVPIGKNKTPLRGALWSKPIDPHENWDFEGLALKTGAVSGLTVIDYDSLTPDLANVTTKRGGHVWVNWDNDRVRHYPDRKVDVQGSRGLAIFHSPTHQVVDLTLRDRSDYADLLDDQNLLNCSIYNLSMWDVQVEGNKDDHQFLCRAGLYVPKVERAGFTIDVEWATKSMESQTRNSPEGIRNFRMYTNARNVLMIGGDPERIYNAAYTAGLPGHEIVRAKVRLSSDHYGVDIFELAHAWLEQANEVYKPRKASTAEYLVRAAIRQHSTRPMFSQQQHEQIMNIDRRQMRNQFKAYEEAGVLKKYPQSGYIPGTFNTPPNNYQLILKSEQ